MVVFHTFSGSTIDLSAYFWIDTAKTNLLAARDSALEVIKAALEKKGIEMPFPTQTVHLQTEN
jgi:small-conductance mechanosensitive channel